MIVTHRWLKEFVDFALTPDELSHRLTMAGLEVDTLHKIGEGLDDVVVARLLEVAPHPEADRLTLCRVDNGREEVQVVCGARNHKTGDLVALAQVGAVLPGDFKIKKSKIRGLESCGMLCSEKELGLAAESEGILILPPGLPLGQPVFAVLGLKDARYELGLTPNRPDCLSVVGVAREVSAMSGCQLRLPRPVVDEAGPDIASLAAVVIEEPELCPRYAARLICGVTIGPSPAWLVRRLEAVGMRSINNVVDVTNYVLMELGHPLHAFDFALLRGGRIVVRRSGEGEGFTTLDSQVRQLKSSDLTICDGVGAVALAGIMGGENSEIRPETRDILLESAYFNPAAIRRTSKRLGLHSESSHRFERGADIDMVPVALNRAAALILEVAGGTVARGVLDVYPQPLSRRHLTISTQRTHAILGIELSLARIGELLAAIGLDIIPPVGGHPDGLLTVAVPSFRPDLEREIDLIEEVARLHGYDQIVETLPVCRIVSQRLPQHQKLTTALRDAVVACGFAETINYSFVSPGLWDKLQLPAEDRRRKCVKVLNPLTEEQSVMRTMLAPSMLETLARNLAYRTRDLRLFELRPVFLPRAGEELPDEPLRLCLAICGRRTPEGWAQGNDAVDFFDLKGVLETLYRQFRADTITWQADAGEPYLHPGKSATLYSGGVRLGVVGEVHPRTLAAFAIDVPVYLAELELPRLNKHAGIRPLSRFPDAYRDSALLLDETVTAQQIFELFAKAGSKDAEDLVLFDLYRGPGVPEGKKSVALRVRYRSSEKTLTDEEINAAHGKLVQTLCKKLDATLR
ncbi:MAG: phenylalanine--tRNA ligase subunit beta [Desulfuromonadales bacterium GWC2_61_20]|nr:MAG: phenylalanine--tRNA ligase subunit beta [Desulfuromonadales bacterium GWC2_61_20]